VAHADLLFLSRVFWWIAYSQLAGDPCEERSSTSHVRMVGWSSVAGVATLLRMRTTFLNIAELNATLLSESIRTLVAHWKAATTESLISFRYCTPLVTSVNRLGPVVSGPKHQIFLVMSLSQPNSSTRMRPRVLGSSRGPTLPSSMASARPSSRGRACGGNGFWLVGGQGGGGMPTVREQVRMEVQDFGQSKKNYGERYDLSSVAFSPPGAALARQMGARCGISDRRASCTEQTLICIPLWLYQARSGGRTARGGGVSEVWRQASQSRRVHRSK